MLEVGSKEKHYFYESAVSTGTVADTAFGHLGVWRECFLQDSTCGFEGWCQIPGEIKVPSRYSTLVAMSRQWQRNLKLQELISLFQKAIKVREIA